MVTEAHPPVAGVTRFKASDILQSEPCYSPDETAFHYWHMISKRRFPLYAVQKITEEVQRLQHLSPYGTEAALVKTYVETLLAIPWEQATSLSEGDDWAEPDLADVAAQLDGHHYGLADAKERVLEFLAVQKLTRQPQGTILCLVGPPGVGKTSFANSLAESLGRKFAYVHLGGVQDQAEIRGQRRTAMGALPGRIIQAIQQTGSLNPVIVLDEIDKMVSTHYGDPESALMEVLDFSRNQQFVDQYLEIPIDLSRVLFIATANSVFGLSRALRNRLEIIKISGYTDFEKEKIAHQFLFPRLLKAHGLDEQRVYLARRVLRNIIQHYTREAGVRDLERMLAKICRKTAMAVVRNPKARVRLMEPQALVPYLGVERYAFEPCSPSATVGVVNGLAWTGDGGDLLEIESNRVLGKGKLTITGSIGHVMLESAQAALSYIRCHTTPLGVDPNIVEESDFHIHLPDGATPKDGPSAGMALAISLLSSIKGVPVKPKVAVTGEMTIRGRILPIGGLKEKCLAALRMNFKTVLFPEGNRKELEELPPEIRKRLLFVPVKTLEEALPYVLMEESPLPARKSSK